MSRRIPEKGKTKMVEVEQVDEVIEKRRTGSRRGRA